MPFDPVRIALSNGQEYGPVSWAEAIQWSEQGRIPLNTTIIDHISGERVLASTFAVFVRNAAPRDVPAPSPTPTPPPVISTLVHTHDTEPTSMDFMAFFKTYLGPVIRKRLEALGFRLTEQGYQDVIAFLGRTAHEQLDQQKLLATFEQRISDLSQRQSAIDFLVKSLRASDDQAFSSVVQSATSASEILSIHGQVVMPERISGSTSAEYTESSTVPTAQAASKPPPEAPGEEEEPEDEESPEQETPSGKADRVLEWIGGVIVSAIVLDFLLFGGQHVWAILKAGYGK